MDMTPEELMERVERLSEEMGKIKRALQAVIDGVPFTEAFDDEFFEEKIDAKDAMSQITVMMLHLLKFRFCIRSDPKRGWFKRSISLPRANIINDIEWWPADHSYDKNIVTAIEKKYSSLYKNAKIMYERAARKYTDLKFGLDHLPEECPWTLLELVDADYSDLLMAIPEIDNPLDDLDRAVELINELAIEFG